MEKRLRKYGCNFPLFISLEEKHVLIIGGGRVAARRAGILTEFGCRITVVSPELGDGMRTLWEAGAVCWKQECYARESLFRCIREWGGEKPIFVLAAANEEVNRLAVTHCRDEGIPVNDSSNKENCDFYFPGIVKEGDAVIGITSGGGDHRLAAALSGLVRHFLSESSESEKQ